MSFYPRVGSRFLTGSHSCLHKTEYTLSTHILPFSLLRFLQTFPSRFPTQSVVKDQRRQQKKPAAEEATTSEDLFILRRLIHFPSSPSIQTTETDVRKGTAIHESNNSRRRTKLLRGECSCRNVSQAVFLRTNSTSVLATKAPPSPPLRVSSFSFTESVP